MHPVPGVRYGSYRLKYREDTEWSCSLHDYDVSPDPYDDYYDGDDPHMFDFPEYGCTCATTAHYKGTGVWRYVMESILNEILRNYYLPAITEQLNQGSVFLQALMFGDVRTKPVIKSVIG
jgi:hypothetical protein